MEQQRITPSQSGIFIAGLATAAHGSGLENWQAGGSLPDVLLTLKQEGHINDEQYIAGNRLVFDMTRQHGNTGALISRYDNDSGAASGVPGTYRTDFDAFERMNRILGGLRTHERRLLEFLILTRELRQGALSDYGQKHSNYKTPKTAKALATGRVCSLLETIRELYHGV